MDICTKHFWKRNDTAQNWCHYFYAIWRRYCLLGSIAFLNYILCLFLIWRFMLFSPKTLALEDSFDVWFSVSQRWVLWDLDQGNDCGEVKRGLAAKSQDLGSNFDMSPSCFFFNHISLSSNFFMCKRKDKIAFRPYMVIIRIKYPCRHNWDN